MDQAWVLRKGDAYSRAWTNVRGKRPSIRNVALGLSVATHETRAGDAWEGHNWGATTLRPLNLVECGALAGTAEGLLTAAGLPMRGDYVLFEKQRYVWAAWKLDPKTGKWVEVRISMTAAEFAVLAPITPSVGKGHEARARAAQAAIVAAEVELPMGAIHCDSAPGLGPYFVWFATFENDVKGAEYFIKLLAGIAKPKAASAVLEQGGTPHQLATCMYRARYFTGFHKPDGTMPDGRTGAQANIDEYAIALEKLYPSILTNLSGGAAPKLRRTLRPGMYGPDVEEWTHILNADPRPTSWRDAAGNDNVWPDAWGWPLPEDESFDEQVAQATEAWQARRGLKADAWVGPKTWGAAA